MEFVYGVRFGPGVGGEGEEQVVLWVKECVVCICL